jgi:hypothetical protein
MHRVSSDILVHTQCILTQTMYRHDADYDTSVHLGKATSHPRRGPWHHSCGAERPQAGALSAGEMRRGRAAGHRQQALLHQLVGHVLAHRPPQEASDRLSRVCTKSVKSASGTLGAHFVLSKWYTNAYFLQIYAILYAHLIHILNRLCQYFVRTLCRL